MPRQKAEDHSIPEDAYGVKSQVRIPPEWKPPIYGEQEADESFVVAVAGRTISLALSQGRVTVSAAKVLVNRAHSSVTVGLALHRLAVELGQPLRQLLLDVCMLFVAGEIGEFPRVDSVIV